MEGIEAALRLSLKKLQLDYVDSWIIHWCTALFDWEKNEIIKGVPLYKVW